MASIGSGTEIKIEKECLGTEEGKDKEKKCIGESVNHIEVVKTHHKKSFVILTDEREFTAVHEFGHASGLRHEHAHPWAPYSLKCLYYAGFKDLKNLSEGKPRRSFLREDVGNTAEIMTMFDSSSVMNYCHGFTYIDKKGNYPYQILQPLRERSPFHRYLSVKDRYTLFSTYKAQPLN